MIESFTRLLLSKQEYRDRIFVSDPPGPALLLWTNSDFIPNISGISIVQQEGKDSEVGLKSSTLFEILKSRIYGTVPIIRVQYPPDFSYLVIEGVKYSVMEAASHISELFHLKLGATPAKAQNDANQISDLFHKWSRTAFDGAAVFKTDIDFLIVRDNTVTAIGEVKRSAKVKVGKWSPYIGINGDTNNYLLLMSFANLLNAIMLTIHHEEMNAEISLSDDTLVDVFQYNAEPNLDMLRVFAERKKDSTASLRDIFHF